MCPVAGVRQLGLQANAAATTPPSPLRPAPTSTLPPLHPPLQIYDLETNYFQVSSAMGNAIRGYEGFLGGSKTRAPPPVQVGSPGQPPLRHVCCCHQVEALWRGCISWMREV